MDAQQSQTKPRPRELPPPGRVVSQQSARATFERLVFKDLNSARLIHFLEMLQDLALFSSSRIQYSFLLTTVCHP